MNDDPRQFVEPQFVDPPDCFLTMAVEVALVVLWLAFTVAAVALCTYWFFILGAPQ